MTTDHDRIAELFRKACKSGLYPYLNESDSEVTNFVVRPKDASIPKDNIVTVFSIRAITNEARGNPIKGFDSLMAGLRNSNATSFRIHQAFVASGREFRIFTDADLTQLVGVLLMVKVV